MRHELKPIGQTSIPKALEKANRYRLLNDSTAAESICEDILAVDPDNAEALVALVLAISDQFVDGHAQDLSHARELVGRMHDPYQKAYYSGLLCERWAKGLLHRAAPRAGDAAHDYFTQAMSWYEKAEGIRPPDDDEAILRWNTCARILDRNPHVKERPTEAYEPSLE